MYIAFENLFHKIRSQDPKKTGDPKWKILMVTQKGEKKKTSVQNNILFNFFK